MRKLAGFLVTICILAVIGWIYDLYADTFRCEGPKAINWVTRTHERVHEADAEYYSINDYTPVSQLQIYSSTANQRYIDQQKEKAPGCLSDFQRLTSELLFFEWKIFETLAQGDFDAYDRYFNEYDRAFNQWEQEYYHLATKYNWEISTTAENVFTSPSLSQSSTQQPVIFQSAEEKPTLSYNGVSCILWSDVDRSYLEMTICVYGNIYDYGPYKDKWNTIYFSPNANSFKVTDYNFFYSSPLQMDECVRVYGRIRDIGSYLVIAPEISSDDRIITYPSSVCP